MMEIEKFKQNKNQGKTPPDSCSDQWNGVPSCLAQTFFQTLEREREREKQRKWKQKRTKIGNQVKWERSEERQVRLQ